MGKRDPLIIKTRKNRTGCGNRIPRFARNDKVGLNPPWMVAGRS